MAPGNDTRGWIMTCVSGIACVIGSSIICIDVLVRRFPSKRNFRIQDSNAFLSASLSLSFGVMLFSALYSMLPSANTYFRKAGYSPRMAAFSLVCWFLAGVIGIQILSRFLHQYIPTEIVDCDHTHGTVDKEREDEAEHSLATHHGHTAATRSDIESRTNGAFGDATERTSLLSGEQDSTLRSSHSHPGHHIQHPNSQRRPQLSSSATLPPRRPSFSSRLTSRVSVLVSREKNDCDEGGSCYGYSDVCDDVCRKYVPKKLSDSSRSFLFQGGRKPMYARSATTPHVKRTKSQSLKSVDEESGPDEMSRSLTYSNNAGTSSAGSITGAAEANGQFRTSKNSTLLEGELDGADGSLDEFNKESHHHHVPTNAFLAIGLQTSLAIALHKLPEGFITYATNHASPQLGFAVFMALFIHNITEGFAMALPLYLAIGSRWKAMFWSSLLGGVSQPLGAGLAAIWFKLAGRTDMAPGAGVYGGMFAVTSGIMTSVALQLFSESLDMNHSQGLCHAFAFTGMAILGFSFALTAQ